LTRQLRATDGRDYLPGCSTFADKIIPEELLPNF
jgi:hypothetical protein